MSKNRKIILVVLVILELLTMYLMYKSSHNKKIVLDKVELKEQIDRNSFAVFLDGQEYNETTFPNNAILDMTKTTCINEFGDKIDKPDITYNHGTLTISNIETTYCTLYFNKCTGPIGTVLEGKSEITTCQVGNMYRYQGTDNINNYICFGTSLDCSKSQDLIDKYMYRIIGITADNHLKIMKETDLGLIYWNEKGGDVQNGDRFYNSYLYNQINGSAFLTNSKYISDVWRAKIYDYNYYNGYSNNFDIITAEEIYNIESGKESSMVVGNSTTGGPANVIGEEWDADTFKIGLPYVHDYLYSVSSNNTNCFGSSGCSSWMTYTSNYKTMSVCGTLANGGSAAPCGLYYINSNSTISKTDSVPEYANVYSLNVKPSFYLDNDIEFRNGTTGSKDNPYIIDGIESKLNILRRDDTNGTLSSDLEGGLYRYQGSDNLVNSNYVCFGTSNKEKCLKAPGKYMYRIIGVTTDGKLKVRKDVPLYTAYGVGNAANWTEESEYSKINGTSFLNNDLYLTEEWRNNIDSYNWHYGYDNTFTDSLTTLDYVYQVESGQLTSQSNEGWKSVNAKIGLMYLHDYYYAAAKGGYKCSNNDQICLNSWIISRFKNEWFLSNSGSKGTMAYTNYYFDNTLISSYPKDSSNKSGTNKYINPVFYISSQANIKEGSGLINNPYIFDIADTGNDNFELTCDFNFSSDQDNTIIVLNLGNSYYYGLNTDNSIKEYNYNLQTNYSNSITKYYGYVKNLNREEKNCTLEINPVKYGPPAGEPYCENGFTLLNGRYSFCYKVY